MNMKSQRHSTDLPTASLIVAAAFAALVLVSCGNSADVESTSAEQIPGATVIGVPQRGELLSREAPTLPVWETDPVLGILGVNSPETFAAFQEAQGSAADRAIADVSPEGDIGVFAAEYERTLDQMDQAREDLYLQTVELIGKPIVMERAVECLSSHGVEDRPMNGDEPAHGSQIEPSDAYSICEQALKSEMKPATDLLLPEWEAANQETIRQYGALFGLSPR
jgi:hypothetical protein